MTSHTHAPEKIMATKTPPMASGAKAAFCPTETWIVKSKMAVPINSTAALSLMISIGELQVVRKGVIFLS